MINRIKNRLSFLMLVSFLYCCNSSEYKDSKKNITNQIDSTESGKGSIMYKNYCLTCHGYTTSGTYYQPSLDSMYSLLEKNKFNLDYSIISHEVLISKKDSINFENICSYIKQKYHPW